MTEPILIPLWIAVTGAAAACVICVAAVTWIFDRRIKELEREVEEQCEDPVW